MEIQTIEYIKNRLVAIVSTCSNNIPNGVPVFYVFDEENQKFYFVSKDATQKIKNIKKNETVSIVIYDKNPPQVYSAECKAVLLDPEGEPFKNHVDKLIQLHSHQEYYPTPLDHLKEGSLVLVELEVKRGRLVDYSKN